MTCDTRIITGTRADWKANQYRNITRMINPCQIQKFKPHHQWWCPKLRGLPSHQVCEQRWQALCRRSCPRRGILVPLLVINGIYADSQRICFHQDRWVESHHVQVVIAFCRKNVGQFTLLNLHSDVCRDLVLGQIATKFVRNKSDTKGGTDLVKRKLTIVLPRLRGTRHQLRGIRSDHRSRGKITKRTTE